MTQSRHHHVSDSPSPSGEVDILISRLVDREAGPEEEARFSELAAVTPSLWRTLALQQRDAQALIEQVDRATWRASRTELPRRWLIPARLTWTMATSGWAAVLILALTWALATLVTSPRQQPPIKAMQTGYVLTPEQHYERYREAPYVLGEWQPLVLEVEPLSDGRVAVYFIRRIEEVALLDPKDLPLDENGQLTRDIEKLREAEPKVGLF